MSVKEEKAKQAKVQKDSKKCDHVGYYVGFGFQTLPLDDGSVLGVCAITCMMCGMIFMPKEIIIPAPKSPTGQELALPN